MAVSSHSMRAAFVVARFFFSRPGGPSNVPPILAKESICNSSRNCYMLAPNFPTPLAIEVPRLRNGKTGHELTFEHFSRFLAWLNPDRERAGEEYERLRFRLYTFFSLRRCTLADELADETINRVILKSSEEAIQNKLAYCYGVARNVYREWLRRERPQVDIDEVNIAAASAEEPSFSRECLDKCLAELSPHNRDLVLDYFSEAKLAKIQLHRQISESMKTSQTALRMRVMRIKQKLKSCVNHCMAQPDVT